MNAQENNDIDLIENFLDGKLSSGEEEELQLRLKSDMEFAKLFRFRLKIRDDWERARQYEAINREVAGAIRQIKRKQRQIAVYAVAASLAFLVIVSGILSIMGRQQGTAQKMAETKDSMYNDEIELKMKKPDVYADSGIYNPENMGVQFSMCFETRDDSLFFSWQPALKTKTDLVIQWQKTKKEVFRKSVQPGSVRFTMYAKELPAGKMIWSLDGFAAADSINIP